MNQNISMSTRYINCFFNSINRHAFWLLVEQKRDSLLMKTAIQGELLTNFQYSFN